MKQKTAINNVKKIRERLVKSTGIIHTPFASHPYFKIKKVWLFGSFAKGKKEPSDIDIIYEGTPCGNYRWHIKGVTKPDKRFRFLARDSENDAIKELKKDMKKIHIMPNWTIRDIDKADAEQVAIHQDVQRTKIMIYPRFDAEKLLIHKEAIIDSHQ